jgi:hypothetical protein
MHIIKLLSIIFLFVFITFGIIGGCGSSDGNDGDEELAGELICDDGIDNDEDTEIDCDDIDCILDPACTGASCEEFVEAFCNRIDECGIILFIPCEESLALQGLDCDILEGSVPQQCIDDISENDCNEVDMGNLPESCGEDQFSVIGGCEECEDDLDCEEGLICIDCIDECTGSVKRCTVAALAVLECEDGLFRTQE